jgi:hypothetical protein
MLWRCIGVASLWTLAISSLGKNPSTH